MLVALLTLQLCHPEERCEIIGPGGLHTHVLGFWTQLQVARGRPL